MKQGRGSSSAVRLDDLITIAIDLLTGELIAIILASK
jgi:hypothetical protein